MPVLSTFAADSVRGYRTLGGKKAILEWLINEGTGTLLNDSSGNGYNCTFGGQFTWQNTSPSPPAGSTWYLTTDGSSGQTLSVASIVFGVQIITLDFWMYSTDWTTGGQGGNIAYNYVPVGNAGIFNVSQDGSGDFDLTLYDGAGNVRSCYVLASYIPNNTWLHFQIVINDSNGSIQVYINSGGNVATAMVGTFTTATNIATGDFIVLGNQMANVTDFQIFSGDTHTL